MRATRIRAFRVLATVVVAGCAQAYPPPGGELERIPPAVVSTTPEHLSVIQPGTQPVVFRFDKRISERGADGVILVSPETGEVRVDRGRAELRVSIRGGWRPNTVYRVVLLPGLRDLFGNERRYPAEVVFSTGPAIDSTAVAGIVTDRITGRSLPARAVRVEAIREADSTVYAVAPDADGLFAMRYLPAGSYTVRAFADQNRNRRLDPPESRAEARINVGVADTAMVALALLAPDTTPARLVRAEARDSFQIELTLDDYVDPTVPLDGVTVLLRRVADSAAVAVDAVLFPHELRGRAAAGRLVADDPVADTATADGVARSGRGAQPPGRGGPAGGRGGAPDGPAETRADSAAPRSTVPLPVRELIVVPAGPLAPATRYEVEVHGIVNLWGLPDGGGSAQFETPGARRPPSPAPRAEQAPGSDRERDGGAGAGVDPTPDAAPGNGVGPAAGSAAGPPSP